MLVDPLADTCGAGASDDQAVLDVAPKDTKWVTTDSGWIGPVSKTAGPVVDTPIRSCFEHSAEGALYAATWAYIQVNSTPESYMPTVIGRVPTLHARAVPRSPLPPFQL